MIDPRDKYYKEMKEAKNFIDSLIRPYHRYWQKYIYDMVTYDELANIAFDSEPMETCARSWAKFVTYYRNIPEDILYQVARYHNYQLANDNETNKKDTIDGYYFLMNGGECGGNR